VAGADDGVDVAREARQADLIVLEDLQRLPSRSVAAAVEVLDQARAQGRLVMVTANGGPAQLGHLSARLTSRCSSGLVVGLQPLARSSRLTFLQDRARRRRLNQEEALVWLADHLGGSARELEGAVVRLQTLTRLLGHPPDIDELEEHFRPEAESRRTTVEGIVRRVGRYFQVTPRDLRAPGRARQAVLPRQVGMYLARRLTPLSLQQIGAYFGGRDHTTVLHACRKVEQALSSDAALEGAIRCLHAELA
jgi:chromosomal replication initiator protein